MCLVKTFFNTLKCLIKTPSNKENAMKEKIEKVMSDILSMKHDAKITIKFVKPEEKTKYDNSRKTRGSHRRTGLSRDHARR